MGPSRSTGVGLDRAFRSHASSRKPRRGHVKIIDESIPDGYSAAAGETQVISLGTNAVGVPLQNRAEIRIFRECVRDVLQRGSVSRLDYTAVLFEENSF